MDNELVLTTIAGVSLWCLLCGPDIYKKFHRRVLVRRLREVRDESAKLWDIDEANDLANPLELMQREKELEAETEQLMLQLGLDPDEVRNRTSTKSRR